VREILKGANVRIRNKTVTWFEIIDGNKIPSRETNMSRSSIFPAIVISAIIGAVVGAILVYGVLGKSMSDQIAVKMASYAATAEEQNSQPAATDPGTQPANEIATKSATALDPEELAVTNVYNRVSPSVVHVSTVQYARNFFFQIVPQEGLGSGFIISEDGYILTNNHVIAGAQEITVRLSNGEEYAAELVGADEFSDIAVLRLPDVEIQPDWVAPLGDSDALQVGQRAIAIGNPFGLDSTVTVGVVSALNRPLSTGDVTFENMIQTDASINPGNSGGPLFDSGGKVIGINTVIYSQSGGSHGIGFAIPINAAKQTADDLIQYGRVRRPSLGFSGLTIYPAIADALHLPVAYGVLVQEVDHGSGADNAGLRGGTNVVTLRDRFRQYSFYNDGDIIIGLNGEKVTELTRLTDQIQRMDLGTEVTLTVMRNGEQVDLTMVLTE
jgi:S1-C subfamily serine protease